MPQFPRSDAETVVLAHTIIEGLKANADVFTAPPITATALQSLLDAFQGSQSAATAAAAAASQAYEAKEAALTELADGMKAILSYAEHATGRDDAQLKKLGWGGRAARKELEPPGQSRTLEAPRQGEGWLFLDWKEPVEGGKVAAYKVQRRERPTGEWQDITTALQSETTLVEQARGKELEYRVVAVNRAGEGAPSNTVMVVL